MKKRFFSMMTGAVLITALLAGCGGSDQQTDSSGGSTSAQESASSNEEPYNITMVYVGTEQPDMQRIEDAISELTLEKLNMTVDIIQMSFGDYQNRLNMMLSGGDALDIIPINAGQAASYINAGQVVDLSGYVEEYGQGIVDSLGDKAYMGTINGFLYGFPTHKESQARSGIVMRKDIVDKYNIDIDSIHSYEDLTPIYEMLHEAEPNMNLLVGKGSIRQVQNFDPLTDMFGVLDMNSDEPTKVINWFECDEFIRRAEILRDWYEKGYVMPDAATTTESNQALVKAGNTFSYMSSIKPGFLIAENQNCGYEMCYAIFDDTEYIYSSGVNFYNWGIAANSQDPEKAMEFLNFMYTSPEFNNLLNWGQEGVDYVRVEGSENLITYPEGTDPANVKYHLNIGWELPNQFLGYIWEGNPEDLWEQYEEFDNSATRSPAYGFVYDSSSLSNELTALNNVYNQYNMAIETGSADPETVIPQMNQALYDAGLQKVMDEKQRQLDEWLASNGSENSSGETAAQSGSVSENSENQ